MEEQKKPKQSMIGLQPELKERFDTQMKAKGYLTRQKYMRHLLDNDSQNQ